jgi:hypothetical protein
MGEITKQANLRLKRLSEAITTTERRAASAASAPVSLYQSHNVPPPQTDITNRLQTLFCAAAKIVLGRGKRASEQAGARTAWVRLKFRLPLALQSPPDLSNSNEWLVGGPQSSEAPFNETAPMLHQGACES